MRNLLWTLWLAAALRAQPTDVFLLIGQSNMAGRGVVEEADKKPIPGVWAFSKEKTWIPAVDPIHFDRPDRTGVGLGRRFATTLQKLGLATQVGLIPAAFGGSALAEWQPGAGHYKNAVERTKAALASGGRLRGILWHQGEADTAKSELANSYRERMIVMVNQLRRDLGAEGVPFLVGQLGEFLRERPENPHPYALQVNEALATLPLHLPKSAFVSSQGLGHKGDILHFDTPALREFGRRYALAWAALENLP
jgi:hypothetical protein